jgi:hypothetical protein
MRKRSRHASFQGLAGDRHDGFVAGRGSDSGRGVGRSSLTDEPADPLVLLTATRTAPSAIARCPRLHEPWRREARYVD